MYVVMNGGVLSFVFSLSTSVWERDVNGMCVFAITLGGNFLFCKCCLCVFTVFSYVVGSELDLRNLMHSPLAMDLYVEMG